MNDTEPKREKIADILTLWLQHESNLTIDANNAVQYNSSKHTWYE